MGAHLRRSSRDAVRLDPTTTFPKTHILQRFKVKGFGDCEKSYDSLQTNDGSAGEVGHCSGLDIFPFRKQNMINVKGVLIYQHLSTGLWNPNRSLHRSFCSVIRLSI